MNDIVEPAPVAGAARARRRGRAPAIALGVALIVVAAAFFVLQGYLYGRVPFGVHAGGVSLAGDRAPQARAAIAHELTARQLGSVVLQTREGALTVPLADLGLRVDVAATARLAALRGRAHVAGLRPWLGGRGAMAPVVRFDPGAFEAELQKIATVTESAPHDAGLTLVGRHDPRAAGTQRPGYRRGGPAGRPGGRARPVAAVPRAGAAHCLAAGREHGRRRGRRYPGRHLPEHAAPAPLPQPRDRFEPGANGHDAHGQPGSRRDDAAHLRQSAGACDAPPPVLLRRDAGGQRAGDRQGPQGRDHAEPRGLRTGHAAIAFRHGLRGQPAGAAPGRRAARHARADRHDRPTSPRSASTASVRSSPPTTTRPTCRVRRTSCRPPSSSTAP